MTVYTCTSALFRLWSRYDLKVWIVFFDLGPLTPEDDAVTVGRSGIEFTTSMGADYA